MQHKTIIIDGYIRGVCMTTGEGNISQAQYDTITELFHNKPTAPDGFDYRLKADLTWELVELPPMPIDDELTAEEALDIITGGGKA